MEHEQMDSVQILNFNCNDFIRRSEFRGCDLIGGGWQQESSSSSSQWGSLSRPSPSRSHNLHHLHLPPPYKEWQTCSQLADDLLLPLLTLHWLPSFLPTVDLWQLDTHSTESRGSIRSWRSRGARVSRGAGLTISSTGTRASLERIHKLFYYYYF